MNQSIKNPAKSANSCGVTNASKHRNFNPVEAILQRLENVKKEGKGFRALCPACGGTARKLTIVEGDDGRALIHCFGCNDTLAILKSLGLNWADIYPFRAWPKSPEEKRRAFRIMREVGWRSALSVLDYETTIVCIACGQILGGHTLSSEDFDRLMLASSRIAGAREVLI